MGERGRAWRGYEGGEGLGGMGKGGVWELRGGARGRGLGRSYGAG